MGRLSKAKLFSQTMRLVDVSTPEMRKAFQSMAKQESRMNAKGEMEDRYIFPDGSALIVTENGWGVEGKTPWSWKAVTFDDSK